MMPRTLSPNSNLVVSGATPSTVSQRSASNTPMTTSAMPVDSSLSSPAGASSSPAAIIPLKLRGQQQREPVLCSKRALVAQIVALWMVILMFIVESRLGMMEWAQVVVLNQQVATQHELSAQQRSDHKNDLESGPQPSVSSTMAVAAASESEATGVIDGASKKDPTFGLGRYAIGHKYRPENLYVAAIDTKDESFITRGHSPALDVNGPAAPSPPAHPLTHATRRNPKVVLSGGGDDEDSVSTSEAPPRRKAPPHTTVGRLSQHVHPRTYVPYALPNPANTTGLTANSGRRYRGRFGLGRPPPVPIGEGHDYSGEEHFPFWGPDFVDEGTTLVLAMDPETPPADAADRYARPEDADALARVGSIWHTLSTRFRNAQLDVLLSDTSEVSALCLISVVYSQSCAYLDESFEDCVLRVGHNRLKFVLSERCRFSQYWLIIERDVRQGQPSSIYKHGQSPLPPALDVTGKPLPPNTQVGHGKVPHAEICSVNRPEPPFIRAELRDHPPMGPPRQCRDGGLQYPIAFGTPRLNMVDKVFPKLFDFMPIPIDVGSKKLAYNDEDTYQALAALSHFCMTHARGGWDCGRHYEVMGAGCVPYFYDIHASPPYILPHFPKKLLMDIVKKPFFKHIGYVPNGHRDNFSVPLNQPYAIDDFFNDRSRARFVNETFRIDYANGWDKQWYWETARKLLKYTQKYLTAEGQAAHVIRTMGVRERGPDFMGRVLFVANPHNQWDNLQQSLITGFDGLGYEVSVIASNHSDIYRCHGIGDNEKRDFTMRRRYLANDTSSVNATVMGALTHRSAAPKLPRPSNGRQPHDERPLWLQEEDGVHPTMMSGWLARLRGEYKRNKVHGNGAPWANRLRSRKLRFHDKPSDVFNWLYFQLYDAVIFSYMPIVGTFDYALVNMFRESTGGRVAVMDNMDTMDDPRLYAKFIDKEVYYFSRELRRVYC